MLICALTGNVQFRKNPVLITIFKENSHMETYKFIKITNNKTGMSYITRTRKSLEYTKDRFKQQANS